MANEQPNHKWVQLACALMTTMLATPEGLKYLGEDKLLKQLGDCFAELETVRRAICRSNARNPLNRVHTCPPNGWRGA